LLEGLWNDVPRTLLPRAQLLAGQFTNDALPCTALKPRPAPVLGLADGRRHAGMLIPGLGRSGWRGRWLWGWVGGWVGVMVRPAACAARRPSAGFINKLSGGFIKYVRRPLQV
jgi:hypothetical protein